jgi:hypothetical protein
LSLAARLEAVPFPISGLESNSHPKVAKCAT